MDDHGSSPFKFRENLEESSSAKFRPFLLGVQRVSRVVVVCFRCEKYLSSTVYSRGLITLFSSS